MEALNLLKNVLVEQRAKTARSFTRFVFLPKILPCGYARAAVPMSRSLLHIPRMLALVDKS